MKKILRSRLLRWAFLTAAIGIGGYEIADKWHQISHALGTMNPGAIAAAFGCVLLAQVATLRTWQTLLRGLGSPLPAPAAARILFIGQLGKYVPGALWPVLVQMELGTAYRVPRHRSASASVLTMLMSLLTGLLAAAVTLPLTGHAHSYLWAFAALPVVLACLHPRVLRWGMDRLLRLARQPGLEHPLRGPVLASALAWALAAWVGNGLQIWLLVHTHSGTSLLLSVGGYAFAWCVGFLIVFLPGGLGAREVILVAALTPVGGAAAATAVALVSRVLTTASDLLCAGVAAAAPRPSAAGQPVPPEKFAFSATTTPVSPEEEGSA